VKLRELGTLKEGSRFRLPLCGKTGVLLRVTPGGASVKYEGTDRDVEFDVKRGDEVTGKVAFTAPGRALTISSGAMVEVL
jgi:hypothetical protein